jgi:hypothetical protein
MEIPKIFGNVALARDESDRGPILQVGRTSPMKRRALIFVALVGASCTGTAPTVYEASGSISPELRAGSIVAVFQFDGPYAAQARDIAAHALVTRYGVTMMPFGRVDEYAHTAPFTPTDLDQAGLSAAMTQLNADAVLWGTVNQFTSYYFNRLAPAVPPYVDETLFLFAGRPPRVMRVAGHMQGSLPLTIWERQPTFEDVATALSDRLVTELH